MADNLQIYGHDFDGVDGIRVTNQKGEILTYTKDNDDAQMDDVVFLDYDGKIRYSYSAADFANLTSLPPNPNHTSIGLVAQGWNWDLADAKTYVSKYGSLEIGQTYTTASGATEIDVCLLSKFCLDVAIGLGIYGTITIDWGDGSEVSTVTGTALSSTYYTTHIYSDTGKHTVKIKEIDGYYGIKGLNSGGSLLFMRSTHPDNYNQNKPYHNCVKAIRIGEKCKLTLNAQASGNYQFKYLGYLNYITIPKSYGSSWAGGNFSGAFTSCLNLSTIIFPLGMTSGGFNAAGDNGAVKWISIPSSATVTQIGYYFRSNANLTRLSTPQSVTDLNTAAFNATGLAKLIIPENVTNITGQFYVDSPKVILCAPTTPPTLQASNSLIAPDCVIYVPYSADHSILTAYQQATNWSVFAEQMEEYQ